jgi:hypothetical protein
MVKPNFFIVGKPKSGTTALHRMLDQHPDIYMSPVKEPSHFARDAIEAAERRGTGFRGLPYKNLDDYLALFRGVTTEKVVGESSTAYLLSRVAAQQIKAFNPDARILMIFREPVDFLYSFHHQLLRSGNEDEGDFRKALLLEEERKQGRGIPRSASDPAKLFYSEQVKYAEQLQRFIDAFGKSSVKVFLYDDFRDDNLAVYKEALEFLQVDPEFVPEVMEVNRNKEVRFVKLANWLIYHGERKQRSFKQLAPAWVVSPIAKALSIAFFRKAPRARLDPRLSEELTRQCKPEVVRLGEVLKVDLVKRWGYEDI